MAAGIALGAASIAACTFGAPGLGDGGTTLGGSSGTDAIADTGAGPTSGGVETTDAPPGTTSPTDTGPSVDDSGSGSDPAAFAFKRQLSFSLPAGGTMDLPVRIHLDDTRIEFDEVQASGADVRFYDATESTVLPHEIEHFEAGSAELWVRVPEVANGSSIWMYYGDPDAPDAQDPAAVWAGFGGVYHLTDDAADASASGTLATQGGVSAVDGIIGPARHFDGTGRIDVSDGVLHTSGGAVTLWFRTNVAVDRARLMFDASVLDNADGYGQGEELELHILPAVTETRMYFYFSPMPMSVEAVAFDGAVTGPVDDGQWHYGLMVWGDGEEPRARRDDVPGVDDDGTDVLGASWDAQFITLGAPVAVGSDRIFEGDLDEVRVHTTRPDAEYIAVDELSQRDQLVKYSMPEPVR